MAPISIRERLLAALRANAPRAESPLDAQRRAAIAMILLEQDAELEVLLIERAERPGDPWSGHMALPGGHAEPDDLTLAATAERETLEEVGIDLPAAGERLGALPDAAPMRGVSITVRPFVYLLSARPELRLSREIRSALWVPVAPLSSGQRATSYAISRPTGELRVPAWDVAGRIVWGLTYRVLDDFFREFNLVSAAQSGPLDNAGQPR